MQRSTGRPSGSRSLSTRRDQAEISAPAQRAKRFFIANHSFRPETDSMPPACPVVAHARRYPHGFPPPHATGLPGGGSRSPLPGGQPLPISMPPACPVALGSTPPPERFPPKGLQGCGRVAVGYQRQQNMKPGYAEDTFSKTFTLKEEDQRCARNGHKATRSALACCLPARSSKPSMGCGRCYRRRAKRDGAGQAPQPQGRERLLSRRQRAMKCLNKRAEKIFRQLIDGLTEPGDHRKIDNTGGTFMRLSIDVLSVTPDHRRARLVRMRIAGPQLGAERRPDGRSRRGVPGHAALASCR